MSRLHEHAVIPSVVPSVTDFFCDSCVSGLLSCAIQHRREKVCLGLRLRAGDLEQTVWMKDDRLWDILKSKVLVRIP